MQIRTKLEQGDQMIIANALNTSREYVCRVLNGSRSAKGAKAKMIIAAARMMKRNRKTLISELKKMNRA